jgi:hypothetical protein
VASDSPQHVLLTANTVSTVTIGPKYRRLLVLSTDGLSPVYYTTDGSTPTVRGTGCEVLPPTITGQLVTVSFDAATTVKLISAGTPSVMVKGLTSGG